MATVESTKNVKLGSCDANFGTTDLGLTKGGIQVSITTNTKQIQVDQFGQTIVNEYIMGRTGTVKVPMAEYDLEKLVSVLPGATLVTDSVDDTKKKLVLNTGVGLSLLDYAKPLILHPTGVASTDKSEDVEFPLAAPTGNLTYDYNFENERVYTIDFTIYPNPETGLIAIFGDKTAAA